VTSIGQLATNPHTATTNNGNGQVATAAFSLFNPQGVTLSYQTSTESSFDFCKQLVCNDATFSITTIGVTGNAMRTATTSYCITLKGTPSLTTTFVSCPSTFVAEPQTNVSICNNGNGQATSISFSQSVFNGCSVISSSSPSFTVSCNGATCTGTLSSLNPGQCANVVINFDCTSVGSGSSLITLTSQASVSETCVDSTSSSSCAFTFTPQLPPSLTTIFTTCPASYSSNVSTVALTCNVGTGTAFNVAFNQSVLSGCTPISTSSALVTCSDGFCTGNIGTITSANCENITIDFDCSYAGNSTSIVNFVSSFNAQTASLSSTSPPCSFDFTPIVSCKITLLIGDLDYDDRYGHPFYSPQSPSYSSPSSSY